jgi:serine/threonine-protein kinase PRP4
MSTDSADEGEIVESGVDDLKATTLQDPDGNGVDRRDRTRGRYSQSPGPEYSRSSGGFSQRGTSPRGYKRSRDDRDQGRGGSDPRRFRIHYEDRSDHRSSRPRADGYNQSASRGHPQRRDNDDRLAKGGSRYGERSYDRDRYPDKRPRTRSRSPPPSSRNGVSPRERSRKEHGRSEPRSGDDEFSKQKTWNDMSGRKDGPDRLAKAGDVRESIAKTSEGVTAGTRGRNVDSQRGR